MWPLIAECEAITRIDWHRKNHPPPALSRSDLATLPTEREKYPDARKPTPARIHRNRAPKDQSSGSHAARRIPQVRHERTIQKKPKEGEWPYSARPETETISAKWIDAVAIKETRAITAYHESMRMAQQKWPTPKDSTRKHVAQSSRPSGREIAETFSRRQGRGPNKLKYASASKMCARVSADTT